MALVVFVDRLEGILSKTDRIAKITFRGLAQFTKVHEANEATSGFLDFNEKLEWPLASGILPTEVLEIQIYHVNKLFSNKIYGSFRMILQQLVRDGQLAVMETLLDGNNTSLESKIYIRIEYQAPDGTVGSWKTEQFGRHQVVEDSIPLIEQQTTPDR